MSTSPSARDSRRGPSDLGRLQNWWVAVTTHPEGIAAGAASDEARRWIDAGPDGISALLTRSGRLTAAERLAVYGNAYFARLLECLGEVYPVLKRTLGDDIFDGFALGYLQSYPSKSYTLHHLGGRFAEFLRDTRPPDEDAEWPGFLIDLARLEWAIYEVFDGPGMESADPWDARDLMAMPPETWDELRIRCAPCLRLLTFDHAVNDHFTRARSVEGEVEIADLSPGLRYVAVTRRDYIVRRYELSRPQHELLSALQAGETLGEALWNCAQAAEAMPDLRLESALPLWFRNWSAERCFFSGIDASEPG